MSQSRLDNPAAGYFPAFDWLRLVLAMAVALSHGGGIFSDPNVANFSVQVFFALSGWLIGGILLDSDKSKLPRFYFNRATRIWAPYYFAVALLFATSLLKEPLDAHWLEYLFYDLTYTHNWFITPRIEEIFSDLPLQGTINHFWSLGVEEQFYLFAPLVILFMRWGRSPLLWLGATILAISLHTFYGSICMGVLAVALHRKYGDWHLRWGVSWLLALGLALCIGAYVVKPDAYWLIAPFAAVFIVLLLARSGRKTAIGSFVGGISYPLYLNHWIGIFVSHEIVQAFGFIGDGAGVVIGAVLNLAVASVLFLAIDEQVRKRRGAWFTDGRGRMAAKVAYGLVALGAVGGLLIGVSRL